MNKRCYKDSSNFLGNGFLPHSLASSERCRDVDETLLREELAVDALVPRRHLALGTPLVHLLSGEPRLATSLIWQGETVSTLIYQC